MHDIVPLSAGRPGRLVYVARLGQAPHYAGSFHDDAFARAMGEYGSVVLISGNLERHTQVAPAYVYQQIQNDDLAGAAATSTVRPMTPCLATQYSISSGTTSMRATRGSLASPLCTPSPRSLK